MVKILLCLLFTIILLQTRAQTSVGTVLCEYQSNPTGISTHQPRLSWELISAKRNTFQNAYQILVSTDSVALFHNSINVLDTRVVISTRSQHVPFNGPLLKAGQVYFWKVRVWDNHHFRSPYSRIARWQMGLLTKSDWKKAHWIAYDSLRTKERIVPGIDDPSDPRWNTGNDILPVFRKEFLISGNVSKVTAYITGLGQFEMSLNGAKVGDHFLDPGWTLFESHTLYEVFDLTTRVRQGPNAIGVMLGNGFFFIPGERYHKLRTAYGFPKLICRIAIQYANGATGELVSDSTWKASPGPVTFSSIYGGEDYNALKEQRGWDTPGFEDTKWRQAIEVTGPGLLVAQTEEPLRQFERFSVQKITQPKPGVRVYDMGQNASAIPQITVKGAKGSVLKITPGELLDTTGQVTQAAIGAPVYFKYTLKGAGNETWQPRFMYYGFRYLEVECISTKSLLPEDVPVILSITSIHTRNSTRRTGTFSCSNDLLDRTYKLIDWSIQSNMASIFTDCPHREKLGWLEEAHLMGSSIHFNYDIATLGRKVVYDMIDSQTSDGLIPDIAPEYVHFSGPFRDSPEWGSSGIILPYYLYTWYGDKGLLEVSYQMMQRCAAYLEKQSVGHILKAGLGDWYDIGKNDPGPSQNTPAGITGTAIYYYDLTLLAKIATILNRPADARSYKKLSQKIKTAYNNAFFKAASGEYKGASQTANAISLYCGLVPQGERGHVLNTLLRDLTQHGTRITAGDIGFRYLLQTLDEAGRSDIIYEMNSLKGSSAGYSKQLESGATALTESWQGNPNSSNNHLMLGHLMEWFYSGLGGITQLQGSVAYKKILIRPQFVGNITSARVTFFSPYGLISNQWTRKGSMISMLTTIPANTSATLSLPQGVLGSALESGCLVTSRNAMRLVTSGEGRRQFVIGSGTYSFRFNLNSN